MLISKVPDDDGGKGESCDAPANDDSHEYETASELFELMAKNQNFNINDGDTLTPRDLVLLYKNIDLGTKLMSNANEIKLGKPNQHVETVVHTDDPESDGSDVSDVYSNEDIQNVFLINKERLDLFNIPSSVENTLCHKFGDIEIQTSNKNMYDKYFLFKDPYIKDQLRNFNLLSNDKESTIFPTSLLDYVCCKRLEDNYNFYMDNIIRYVKNTIEQLKRISNGDYLTEKAKEKWREVKQVEDASNTKVLATSTSIPLHVECKAGGRKSTWDDIVHSEVDVRSLSKILEKKIVVEVPKFISGSYKLLSKCYADNLIICCKKDQPIEDSKKESRVDVVFQLKRSETGQVVSNISSIMILQTAPCSQGLTDIKPIDVPLPLMYKEISENETHSPDHSPKITELDISTEDNDILQDTSDYVEIDDLQDKEEINEDVYSDSLEFSPEENHRTVTFMNLSKQDIVRDLNNNNRDKIQTYTLKEATFDVCPADLRMTIQRLSIQSALPEENVDDSAQLPPAKKSPTRVRIKSPYENQSYAMEEKKRRKLLEIRAKRERKKMAMAESCKITKNKYGKGAPTPQASSSVTKLSITNKSFYNSIYGHSTDVDSKQTKIKNRKGDVPKEVLDVDLENLGDEQDTPKMEPEMNNKKFINRSYYLDDTVTEMMYMNMKQSEYEKDVRSASTSGVSGEFRTNLNLLSQLIGPSDSDVNVDADDIDEKPPPDNPKELCNRPSDKEEKSHESCMNELTTSHSTLNIVPMNSPEGLYNSENDKKDLKKIKSSVECRKSIDKIYQLMKNMGKHVDSDVKSQNKCSTNTSHRTDATGDKGSSSIPGSDSGTSLKHHLTSSNPSTFSFDKNNNNEVPGNSKISGNPATVIPKVIISSKSQIPISKTEADKIKKERKSVVLVTTTTKAVENNPLKAISQLLHEFENVQRHRLKSGSDQKSARKFDATTSPNDGKNIFSLRQGPYKRRSRFEQHNDVVDKNTKLNIPKDKRTRQPVGMDLQKIPYQQVPTDDRYIEKNNKKKITDILDEAKEARGEAVRGPSKFNSRLNSLAQPKKSYVQAHSEEYQSRYGRNIITDRLQRLAAAPAPTVAERTTGLSNTKSKVKRYGTDAVSAVSLKLPYQSGLPIERPVRTRHSTNNSPETKERLPYVTGVGPSYKQAIVPETPEILNKKMVAVESYVKSHYGRASSSTIRHESPQKSRVPLVPDIDLASTSSSPLPQESVEAGNKLHRIIDSMLKKTSRGLEVLAECHEPNIKSSKNNTDDFSYGENLYRCDEGTSIDSDFTIGTTDDEIIGINNDNICKENEPQQLNNEETNCKMCDIQSFDSATEEDIIEHVLCRPLSVGTFSKHLRIKNLRLTPDPSIQKLFLLQAGDTGSLMLNPSISQSLQTENLLDIKDMPILSKTNLGWNFTNIPMQITTVGYAFPDFTSARPGSLPLTQLFKEVSKSSMVKSSTVLLNAVNKTNPVFDSSADQSQNNKGDQIQALVEQSPKVEIPDLSISPKVDVPDLSIPLKVDMPDLSLPPKVDVPAFSIPAKVDFPDLSIPPKVDVPGLPIPPKVDVPDLPIPPKVNAVVLSIPPKKPNDAVPEVTLHSNNDDNHFESEDVIKNNDKDNETNHKSQLTILQEKSGSEISKESGEINYTTSLDILVGLLNEIKKITTCQTNITKNETQECKELEIILNKTANIESSSLSIPYKEMSFTALDQLRCLESNPSVYSLYLSDVDGPEHSDAIVKPEADSWYEAKYDISHTTRPICVDKEVTVDIPDKEYVNRITDTPSLVFPITINHSTNMSKSLFREHCQTSSQSLISYHTAYSESAKNIIQLSQKLNIKEIDHPKIHDYQGIDKVKQVKLRKLKTRASVKPVNIQKNANTPKIKYDLKNGNCDPVLKMKRDILVTIYSMLVLTVFAALSFPEMLYHAM